MSAFYSSMLTFAGINLIAVLGVYLLIGLTGLFSFGQVGFMAIGAYVSSIACLQWGLPLWVGILISIAFALIVGLFIGAITLKLRTDYFALATYGFAEVVKTALIYFSDITGGSMGIFGIPTAVNLPIVAVIAVICIMICANFKKLKFGRNSLAARNDSLAAEIMGINTFAHKMKVFLLSAVLGALSGALLAFSTSYIEPEMFNWSKSVELIIIVFFGGLNSLSGAVFATLFLSLLPELLRFGSEWRMVLFTFIIIVTIIFKPTGLFGYFEIPLNPVTIAKKIRSYVKKIRAGRSAKRGECDAG